MMVEKKVFTILAVLLSVLMILSFAIKIIRWNFFIRFFHQVFISAFTAAWDICHKDFAGTKEVNPLINRQT